ncbi:MAG: hypothetical protein DRI24_01760 [Deltaproteobacteria bacterium]|nr:MAG: hypothetical protein DRI24_01760 [Deltaproteobacteria bacterium]
MSRIKKGRLFYALEPRGPAQVGALSAVFDKRKWPAIPQPLEEIASINSAVVALKERTQVQSREQGDILSSFVSVQDLINLGVITVDGKLAISALEARIVDIEKRLADAAIP